ADEHAGAICSVFFSPDGKRLAYCQYDQMSPEIKVWDAEHRQEILTFDEYNCVCFSPDGKRLAIGTRASRYGSTLAGVKALDLAGAERRARAAGDRRQSRPPSANKLGRGDPAARRRAHRGRAAPADTSSLPRSM